MSNAVFAALAASLIVITAPTAAQETPDSSSPGGGTFTNIDWTKLVSLKGHGTGDGGVSEYYTPIDSGLAFDPEDSFAGNAYTSDSLDFKPDDVSGTAVAVGKPFGDGNNMLFREAGYAQYHLSPAVMANAIKNSSSWRIEGGFEHSLNDRLSLRLSREYTIYGNDFDQWQTKAGLLAKF